MPALKENKGVGEKKERDLREVIFKFIWKMEENTMKKTLKRGFALMLVAIVLATSLTPVTASAATKKSLTVTMKNVKITKNKTGIEPKRTSQLTVKYGGRNLTSKATYRSSNKKVLSVTKNGKLTAKKNGSATLTVAYKGMTQKLNVKVHNHSWKKHYATKTVKETVIACNCGAIFYTATEEGKKEYYYHAGNHLLAGENDTWHSDTVEKKVKYIDYYYCTCGARKEAE